MNASNIILKTILAVLLAALAGHPIAKAQSKKIIVRIEPIAKAQSKKIIVRIESDSTKRDTFRVNMPKVHKITRIEPVTREFHHYIGYLYVQQNPADINTQVTAVGIITNGIPELNTAKSLHYGLEQLWGLNLIKGKLRFFTGIRYDVYNYRFQSNFVRLTENASEFQAITVGGPTIDPIPMDKSKLVANYIGIPLAIGYQSSPGRWQTSESNGTNTDYQETPKFAIKVGIHTGYLISSHAKLKESGGNITKQYDDFNLNNFIISPFINLEYEDVGLYMRYPLTNIFKAGQGANSQCLQFGITLKFT